MCIQKNSLHIFFILFLLFSITHSMDAFDYGSNNVGDSIGRFGKTLQDLGKTMYEQEEKELSSRELEFKNQLDRDYFDNFYVLNSYIGIENYLKNQEEYFATAFDRLTEKQPKRYKKYLRNIYDTKKNKLMRETLYEKFKQEREANRVRTINKARALIDQKDLEGAKRLYEQERDKGTFTLAETYILIEEINN